MQDGFSNGFTHAQRELIEFLRPLGKKLRKYLLESSDDECVDAYNKVLDEYIKFQDYHNSYVMDYIVKQDPAMKGDLSKGHGSGGSTLHLVVRKSEMLIYFRVGTTLIDAERVKNINY